MIDEFKKAVVNSALKEFNTVSFEFEDLHIPGAETIGVHFEHDGETLFTYINSPFETKDRIKEVMKHTIEEYEALFKNEERPDFLSKTTGRLINFLRWQIQTNSFYIKEDWGVSREEEFISLLAKLHNLESDHKKIFSDTIGYYSELYGDDFSRNKL